ncbi:putative hydrolase or acyltransferase of alpha/beta superfamily [Desulfosporosinus acidiphilus SJ4]|uniref:Putative hydrolase or acyltransferase of alpha/beta superfamily n=1 Tax=Desulfosporosinus acidiphilus (strain DSM 22704 / JCM 16185 / SJ4) TaxID=646529 RepID=I4D2T3_DESAJ|nr:alpha/beta hydrolase [Desulfosporosinus acidiphilus]AFM40107.1 putative hydrolase or acyltransferase of alpha/beta superfamily [Desulfosporosinus acidiphilus SJ4]
MPYVSVGGIDIFFERSDGDSLPLIFIHGAGGSSQRWAKQLSGLQNQLTMIAVDLPGHGNSGGNLLSDIPAMAEFLNQFVRALAVEKFFLAGHSMGGAIAQEFTLRYPNKVEGLILIGTGARLKVGQTILDAFAIGQLPFKDVNHLYGSSISEEQKTKELRELQKIPTKVLGADFQACSMFDRINDVEKIKVPALILVGEEDVMTPVKYSRFLTEKLPDSNLRMIEAAGHMCMEEKATEVNEALLYFFKKL